MREYYSEQSPKRKYYRTSIPADLPFHSPTYIHSHATALVNRRVGKAEDNVANYMEMLRKHLTVVRQEDIRHAKAVYESLKQISEQVASYGINPENLLSDKLKQATEKIDRFRRSLRREQKKTRVKLNDFMLEKLQQFEKSIDINMETAFRDSIFDSRLLNLFTTLLKSKFIKTQKQKKQFENVNLKELTFAQLQEKLNVDIDTFNYQIQHSRGQYLDLTNKDNNEVFKQYWKKFERDLRQIIPLTKQSLTTRTAKELDARMETIKNLSNPEGVYQALGWYMELVAIAEPRDKANMTPEMQETVDALSRGSFVRQEGNKIIIQDSVGRGDHEKTTDIRFLVKEVGETIDNIISIGATLKSSGDEFHKTELMINSQNTRFNKAYEDFFDTVVYSDEYGDYQMSSLLQYFLYNYRALQTFAITDDNTAAYKYIYNRYENDPVSRQDPTSLLNDQGFIQGIPGDTATRLHVKLFNVIDEVFTGIIMTIFIKALLGSFFTDEAAEDIENLSIEGKQDKPLPIFLIAGSRRLWTYEVLGKAIELMEASNDNPKELLKTFQYYSFQKTFSTKSNLQDFSYQLKQLYYEKFLITHGKDSTDEDDNLCPYTGSHAQLTALLDGLNNLLKQSLTKSIGLKNPSDDILKQFFFRDWSVRFNYSNLT